jgi:hypothetical protein
MNKKYINPKTGKKYMFYTPTGKGIEDTLEWAKMFEPKVVNGKVTKKWSKIKFVKQEKTWMGFFVSTVWLGLDHSFWPDREPLIFETMVFFRGKSDLDMDRYTTKQQAIEGHKEMVRKWSNPLYVLSFIISQKTYRLRWKIDSFIAKRRNGIRRRGRVLTIWNIFTFLIIIATMIGWILLPSFPQLRSWLGFGMGNMFVMSLLWAFKGSRAITHDVWCKDRTECGEGLIL